MDLVKNVGGKLDEKIKSGEINESELVEEAAERSFSFVGRCGVRNPSAPTCVFYVEMVRVA